MEKRNIRDCDEFDAELLIKIYPWLEERCKRKDKNIDKIASSYINTYYGAREIYEQIESNDDFDYVEYRIITKTGKIKEVRDYGHLIRGEEETENVFYVFIYPKNPHIV